MNFSPSGTLVRGGPQRLLSLHPSPPQVKVTVLSSVPGPLALWAQQLPGGGQALPSVWTAALL